MAAKFTKVSKVVLCLFALVPFFSYALEFTLPKDVTEEELANASDEEAQYGSSIDETEATESENDDDEDEFLDTDESDDVEEFAEVDDNDNDEEEPDEIEDTETAEIDDDPGFMEFPLEEPEAETAEVAETETQEVSTEGQGQITGQVFDKETGAPIRGVAIAVEGTDMGTITDEKGNFKLNAVPEGNYTLAYFKTGYLAANVTDVAVVPGEVKTLDFALPPRPTELSDDVYDLGTITVTAEQANEQMMKLELALTSTNTLSVLSSEDFSKFADSDIGDAVKRVSGVTVEGGKYAAIRGLGDRYISTTLNGLPIASPDPDRLAVQLDLFPTSLISSIEVKKTFTPDLPGNSSGNINIVVDPIPDEFFLNVSISGGFNDNTHGNDNFLSNDRSTSRDRFAQGASDRGLSDELRGPYPDYQILSRRNVRSDDFIRSVLPDITDEELLTFDQNGTISESYFNSVKAEFDVLADKLGRANHTFTDDAEPDHGIKVSFGDAFDLGSDVRFGYSVGVNYSRKSEFIDEAEYFRSAIRPGGRNSFTPDVFVNPSQEAATEGYHKAFLSQSKVTSVLSASASAGLEFGENHQFGFTVLDLNLSEDINTRLDATKTSDGFGRWYTEPFRGNWDGIEDGGTFGVPDVDLNGDGTPDVVANVDYQLQESLLYVERNLNTLQADGSHNLNEANGPFDILAEWVVGRDKATQDEPGYLQTRGIISEDDGRFTLSTISNSPNDADPSFAIWRTIEEEKNTFKGDLTFTNSSNERFESKIKVGTLLNESDRTVIDEYLVLQYRDANPFLPSPNRFEVPASNNPDAPLRNFDDFYPTAFLTAADIDLTSESRGNYIMLDQQIFENLRLIGGFRYEENSAFVKVNGELQLRGAGANNPLRDLPTTGGFDEESLLPALSLIWKLLDDKLTFRAAYSETLALPSAREVSPYASSTFSGGDVEVGNINLKPSDLKNFDLGFTYAINNGDYITINLFQKDISNRIERVGGLGADSADSDNLADYEELFSFSQNLNAALFSWYNNPNDAELYGLELEVRKALDFMKLNNFSFGMNYTYIDGKVDRFPVEVAAKGPTGSEIFSSQESFDDYRERQLVGQASEIFNSDLTYDNENWGFRVSLIAYYVSDILEGTSLVNSYDVFTKDYIALDLTLAKQITDNLRFGMSIKNLTDSERGTYYQTVVEDSSGDLEYGSIDRDTYKIGASYSFSLSYEY